MKKPIFKNFFKNQNEFTLAQNYWREIIKKILKDNNKNIALKELDEKVLFNCDGNPIYYQHFPSLNKSIRIIQEQVRMNSCPHLGAWIEQADDRRYYNELVISIELTKASQKYVTRIISMWFKEDLALKLAESRLDKILDNHLESYNKRPRRPRI